MLQRIAFSLTKQSFFVILCMMSKFAHRSVRNHPDRTNVQIKTMGAEDGEQRFARLVSVSILAVVHDRFALGSSRKGKQMKKTNTRTIAKAALIAAAYTALTWLSEAMGLGFGSVQFRLSEMLTVLPVFTPAAIPGLVLGCILSNAASPLGPIDIFVGSAATLLQSICSQKLRNVRIKNIPLLSLLMPVFFNAVFVGAEIAFLSADAEGFWVSFGTTALSVGFGELLVCTVLALPLFRLFEKRPALKKLIEQ